MSKVRIAAAHAYFVDRFLRVDRYVPVDVFLVVVPVDYVVAGYVGIKSDFVVTDGVR